MKRIALLMAAALLVGACGGDDETVAEPPATEGEDAVEEPADAEDDDAEDGEWDGPTIPSGTYRLVVTEDERRTQLLDLGFSEAEADEGAALAEDGEFHHAFRIEEGLWVLFWGRDDIGDARGTYTYDERGEWVATEDPCPDDPRFCTYPPVTWSFADDVLTLALDWDDVERHFQGHPDEDWIRLAVYFLFSGEFDMAD